MTEWVDDKISPITKRAFAKHIFRLAHPTGGLHGTATIPESELSLAEHSFETQAAKQGWVKLDRSSGFTQSRLTHF